MNQRNHLLVWMSSCPGVAQSAIWISDAKNLCNTSPFIHWNIKLLIWFHIDKSDAEVCHAYNPVVWECSCSKPWHVVCCKKFQMLHTIYNPWWCLQNNHKSIIVGIGIRGSGVEELMMRGWQLGPAGVHNFREDRSCKRKLRMESTSSKGMGDMVVVMPSCGAYMDTG